jgi:hypothetical protein
VISNSGNRRLEPSGSSFDNFLHNRVPDAPGVPIHQATGEKWNAELADRHAVCRNRRNSRAFRIFWIFAPAVLGGGPATKPLAEVGRQRSDWHQIDGS